VVQAIVLVDRVTRPAPGPFESLSTPGHLLHLVVEGEVEQTVSGRLQRLRPGVAVWYHECEAVSGRILRAPWSFYTVNFVAARLPPPPYEKRMWPAGRRAFNCFERLLTAWRVKGPSLTRHLRSFSLLQELIVEVLPSEIQQHRSDRPSQLWWELEGKAREDLSQPIDMEWLQQVCGRSVRSIGRACELATGMPPMRRIKELRLSFARGLVRYSQKSVTEIALDVGYSRVQDLSRDYRRRFGLTPRKDRGKELEYRIQHVPGEELHRTRNRRSRETT
jgi:AraC-like DNA-binding protein